MGEIKSVKVDNWGVFFLQKLQNFFNKTDYCDMTLQFNDNSQLKVHRLVLSACTDYFNLLETNCEQIDDALVMPNDLQADVVVPIVNFMYTGTLEFELNMYNKLLRTARDMNMTVLLKLLEAHRRTMEQTNTIPKPSPPTPQLRGRQYGTTISPSKQVTIQRGTTTSQVPSGRIVTSQAVRRPIPTQRIAIKEEVTFDPSPFEQLRQSGVNYKRPASKAYETPPEKKPSIEDVKEFAEQQRMRKQLAAADVSGIQAEDEYVESYMEDEFPHDDEEEEMNIGGSQITIKQEPNQKPTIVFKASSDSKMDHAKIIGEVLKKYPHLIKNNKNLKLKIMPNSGPAQQQKVVVKEEKIESPQKQMVTTVQRTVASQKPPTAPTGQPKKIDSKTMHALIALGAENTTGPWLCLRCGVNGRPISIPSYRGFRRHLINTHREKIDPKLCEHCGYRSSDIRDLHFHVQVEHQITSTAFTFPRCEYCAQFFVTNSILQKHIEESHTKNQQCIYCNEVYPKENELYNHMKIAHKKQAQNDGVIDFSDGEDIDDENEFLTFNKMEDKKIKILSDISLPTTSVAVNENTKFVTADGSEMVLSDEQRSQLMAQLDPNQEGGGIIMVLNESFSVPTEQMTVEESAVAIEQEQHEEVHEEQTQVEGKSEEEENLFVYKEETEEEEQLESKEDEAQEEIDNGHEEEKKEELEKMDVEEELCQQEEEKEEGEEVTAENAKSLDDKLKMITGEWTDDEPEDDGQADQHQAAIESKQDEPEESTQEQSEEKNEETFEEKVSQDNEDGHELASPLKQELMEFLGMDNIDDSIEESKPTEIKESETENTESKDEATATEIKSDEVESKVESVEEKPTTTEVEDKDDELAQLQEELESVEKEPATEDLEEKNVVSELEQAESEDKVESTPTEEALVEEAVAKIEESIEESSASEKKEEQEQTKDSLKSIITDWTDEGDGQDDEL